MHGLCGRYLQLHRAHLEEWGKSLSSCSQDVLKPILAAELLEFVFILTTANIVGSGNVPEQLALWPGLLALC